MYFLVIMYTLLEFGPFNLAKNSIYTNFFPSREIP